MAVFRNHPVTLPGFSPPAAPAQPLKIGHVFIIILENESFETTFGADSPAVYLRSLAKQGALLPNYCGIGNG